MVPIDEVYANELGTLVVYRFYPKGSLKDFINQVEKIEFFSLTNVRFRFSDKTERRSVLETLQSEIFVSNLRFKSDQNLWTTNFRSVKLYLQQRSRLRTSSLGKYSLRSSTCSTHSFVRFVQYDHRCFAEISRTYFHNETDSCKTSCFFFLIRIKDFVFRRWNNVMFTDLVVFFMNYQPVKNVQRVLVSICPIRSTLIFNEFFRVFSQQRVIYRH